MTTAQEYPVSRQAVSRRLENKVAIIAGASQGIGAATARRFAQEGATVVLAARHKEPLDEVVQEIIADGGRALAVPADIGDLSAVERLVKQTVDTYGRLDIAFNNAGSGHMPTPLADLTIEQFNEALRATLIGTFLCLKYEIPAMLASGGGAIVNMSSTAGVEAVKGMSGYVAAKHGVIGLTKNAALDYADKNIRVNVVAPGTILTERLKHLTEEQQNHMTQAIPMDRLGTPEEVAATVAFLCSDDAAFITGATILIDGGRVIGKS